MEKKEAEKIKKAYWSSSGDAFDKLINSLVTEDEVAYCPNCGTGAILQREPEAQITKRKIEEWCEENPRYKLNDWSTVYTIERILDWLDQEGA